MSETTFLMPVANGLTILSLTTAYLPPVLALNFYLNGIPHTSTPIQMFETGAKLQTDAVALIRGIFGVALTGLLLTIIFLVYNAKLWFSKGTQRYTSGNKKEVNDTEFWSNDSYKIHSSQSVFYYTCAMLSLISGIMATVFYFREWSILTTTGKHVVQYILGASFVSFVLAISYGLQMQYLGLL